MSALFGIVLLCLTTIVVAQAAGSGTDGTLLNHVRFLLDEEQTLRQRLETRVRALKSEAAALKASIVPCSCPVLPATPQPSSSIPVAYTGTLPAYVSSLTTATVLKFTNDLVNVGQAYNTSTAHFVAPVSGLYEMSLSMFMNPGRSDYWTGLRLVVNGKSLLNIKTGHYYYSSTNRQINMATNSAIANLTAGDEVWPQYVNGGARLWADGVTTFSGVLLHEL